MPSEQQRSKTPQVERDCWRTPPWLFRFLAERFGPFDIDLAGDEQNALCPWWFGGYGMYFVSSFDMDWLRFRDGFCNCPFSDPLPWVTRAAELAPKGLSTTMVLPTHTNQTWGGLAEYATHRIEFIGRVAYYTPDGVEMKSPRGGTQVLHFERHNLGNTRTVWVKTRDLKARYS